jgi:hypothetical protein
MGSTGGASGRLVAARGSAAPSLAAVAAAALLLALAGIARPALGQCTPPTGDTGFAEINVNVTAGTFDKVLPFDVPVRLCGQVPLTPPPANPGGPPPSPPPTLTVQFAEAKNALNVDPKCHILSPAGARWMPGQPIPARIDGTTFRVILPRLQAQRFYAFCFRTQVPVQPAAAAAFQAKAREALDQTLRQVPVSDITAAESAAMRRALRQKLIEATGADEVLAPDTLFDPAPTPGRDELMQGGRLNELVREVLNPQIQARSILSGRPAAPGLLATPSYAELQFRLKGSLEAIRGSAALGRLASLFDQQAEADPNLKKLVDTDLAVPLSLPRRSADEVSRMALGQDPAQPGMPPLDEIADAAQATAAAAQYDAATDALDRLAALCRQVLAGGDFAAVKAGLSEADVAELRSLAAPGGPIALAKSGAFRLAGLARNVQRSLAERSAALDALAREARIEAEQVNVADGSSTGNFDTFQSYYVSADAGIVYAPQVDTGVTYVGANIYLRPVNRDAALSQLGSFRQTFTRRFALTLGLTVQSVADGGAGSPQTRDNLFGNQALLAGAGLRITDTIRLGAGALIFKEKDRNPLIGRFRVASTYYFTLSFDLNVAKAFKGGLGGLFGPTS